MESESRLLLIKIEFGQNFYYKLIRIKHQLVDNYLECLRDVYNISTCFELDTQSTTTTTTTTTDQSQTLDLDFVASYIKLVNNIQFNSLNKYVYITNVNQEINTNINDLITIFPNWKLKQRTQRSDQKPTTNKEIETTCKKNEYFPELAFDCFESFYIGLIYNDIFGFKNVYFNKHHVEFINDNIELFTDICVLYEYEFEIEKDNISTVKKKIINFISTNLLNLTINDFKEIIRKSYKQSRGNRYSLKKSPVYTQQRGSIDKKIIKEFIDLHIINNSTSKISSTQMYNKFKEYITNSQYIKFSYLFNKNNFSPLLKQYGLINKRYSNGVYWVNTKIQ